MTDAAKCDCRTKGIPEGFYCGNPECPEVQEANRQLRSFYERILERQRARSIRDQDKARGTFTAHNWTEDWYLRRIHYAAESQAVDAGRPFTMLDPPRPFSPVDVSPGVS